MQPLNKSSRTYAKRLVRRGAKISPFKKEMHKQKAVTLLDFSLELLKRMKTGEIEGKVVFVGQGMRTLFEAMSALNNALKIVPRKRIRYFVATKPLYAKILGLPFPWPRRKDRENLKRLNIVDGKTRNFLIVDYSFKGYTIEALAKEIRLAQPNAKTKFLTQNRSDVGKIPLSRNAIKTSDVIWQLGGAPVGTQVIKKNNLKRVVPTKTKQKSERRRLTYLALQKAIKEEVERRAP